MKNLGFVYIILGIVFAAVGFGGQYSFVYLGIAFIVLGIFIKFRPNKKEK